MAKAKQSARKWQNRIVGHGEEDAGQLLANPLNWRIHPKNQQDALEGVLSQVGWVQSVIVNRLTGFVVDGHARVAIAITAGEKVPVVYVELTPEEEKLILATLDPLSAMAGTDKDLLGSLLADMELTNDAVKAMMADVMGNPAKPGLTDADDTPDLPIAPVSILGDLWICGEHRVLCGDSTDADSVARLLGGKKAPFLMVTDPPYGVEYDPSWRQEAYEKGQCQFGVKRFGKVDNDSQFDWAAALTLFPGSVAYVWHAGVFAGEVAASLKGIGFDIRGQIIWKKQHFVMGRGAYHWGHEPCWYCVRSGHTAKWHGDRAQSTVWDVANTNPMGGDRQEKETQSNHGTQKPVELMRRPIINHTSASDAVYDPFLGSGTTLIAAEELSRICYGIDIDPAYCDVIITRWQNFTGKQATLEGHSGLTFESVKAGRRMQAEDALKEEVVTYGKT